jgi:hypothetical protein
MGDVAMAEDASGTEDASETMLQFPVLQSGYLLSSTPPPATVQLNVQPLHVCPYHTCMCEVVKALGHMH